MTSFKDIFLAPHLILLLQTGNDSKVFISAYQNWKNELKNDSRKAFFAMIRGAQQLYQVNLSSPEELSTNFGVSMLQSQVTTSVSVSPIVPTPPTPTVIPPPSIETPSPVVIPPVTLSIGTIEVSPEFQRIDPPQENSLPSSDLPEFSPVEFPDTDIIPIPSPPRKSSDSLSPSMPPSPLSQPPTPALPKVFVAIEPIIEKPALPNQQLEGESESENKSESEGQSESEDDQSQKQTESSPKPRKARKIKRKLLNNIHCTDRIFKRHSVNTYAPTERSCWVTRTQDGSPFIPYFGWNFFLGHVWDYSTKEYMRVCEFLDVPNTGSREAMRNAIFDWWDNTCNVIDPELPSAEDMLQFEKVTDFSFNYLPITEEQEAEQNRKIQELEKQNSVSENNNHNNNNNNNNNQNSVPENQNNQNDNRNKRKKSIIELDADKDEELESTQPKIQKTNTSSIATDTDDLDLHLVKPLSETMKFECINHQLITTSYKLNRLWECIFEKGNLCDLLLNICVDETLKITWNPLEFFRTRHLLLSIDDQQMQDELLRGPLEFMKDNPTQVDEALKRSWNEKPAYQKNGFSAYDFNAEVFSQMYSQYSQHQSQQQNQ